MSTNEEGSPKLGFGLSDLYIPPIPASLSEEDKRRADPAFQKFRDDVYATLHSQIQGFPDLCELMRCYNADTGNDPFEMARKFGFRSFNDFLTSDDMKEYVTLTKTVYGEPSYHAAERKGFEHIRKEQVESFQNYCMRRARREGFCDTRRMRPKLLEVAKISQWSAAFCDRNSEAAKQPDVLTRPGPAAASIRRNTSMWGEAGNSDDDYFDDWTEKLTTNMKPVAPDPCVPSEIDWGYEELKEVQEPMRSKDAKGIHRRCASGDDELSTSRNFRDAPIFDIPQNDSGKISWREDDDSDVLNMFETSRLTELKDIPRRYASYDGLNANNSSRATPKFCNPQNKAEKINWCEDED